ncbi:MAG: alpha/beta hydrolase fold domain-containing protein [Bacteroidota bacterium]|nr:alpha/beta hydrolase fold domain-containing protein [Bacteroidota bacterium]
MKKLLLLSVLVQFTQLTAQPTQVNIAYGSHTSHRLDYTTATNPNSPILIVVHGGGWSSGDKSNLTFTNVAQLFKNAGYAVVNINYRLSSQSDYPGHPAIPQDVACAVAWTKTNATLINGDSSKILMYGNSAGAHLVMLHGLTHPNSLLSGCGYSAGLNVSGIIASNPAVNFEYINPGRYADIKPMVGDSINYWKAAAPAHNLALNSTTKFLMLIGQNDNFLGPQQSIIFNDSMTVYNYCKRFYLLPGHDHNSILANLSVSDPIFNSVLDFADSLWLDQLCPTSVGIKETKTISNTIEIFPNPAKENILIKGIDINNSFDVYIYAIVGKLQLHICDRSEIDLENLKCGLYIMCVKQGDSYTYCKFIKE